MKTEKPKPKPEPLTADQIKVGATYRGKRFQSGFAGITNDRRVLWVSQDRQSVQYDSDTVKQGARFPTVTMHKFLNWAKHELPAQAEEADK